MPTLATRDRHAEAVLRSVPGRSERTSKYLRRTREKGVRLLFCLSVLILASLVSGWAVAAPAAEVPAIEYQALPAHDLVSLQSLLASPDWQPTADSPNMGYDDRAYWFRFELEAPSEGRIERITRVGYPQLDDVRFLLFRNGNLEQEYHTGDQRPFADRPISHPQFLFPTTLEAGNNYQVLIRVETEGAIQLPLQVWAPTPLFEHLSRQNQAHTFYYGILTVVIIFNLFIFLALREETYLYYTLAIASYLLLMATLRGTAFALLWPDQPWFHNQMMLATLPAAILFRACLCGLS